MTKQPIIIDTDPGVDDASAILWLLTCGRFDIKAITVTSGNMGLDICVANALRLLEVTGRTEIPVFVGAYRPIIKPPIHAVRSHGEDGMGNIDLPPPATQPRLGYAAAEMVRIVRESDQPVTILAIGPMTNVALAILLDPDFKKNVRQIVIMGGAVCVPGNYSPSASFNVRFDPEAASIVYNAGILAVQVGLDICDQLNITLDDLREIKRAATPVTELFSKMIQFRIDQISTLEPSKWYRVRKDGVPLNDLATTAYVVNPAWFRTESFAIDIVTDGIAAGETVVDFRNRWGKTPKALFAYEVDDRAAIEDWKNCLIHYDGSRAND